MWSTAAFPLLITASVAASAQIAPSGDGRLPKTATVTLDPRPPAVAHDLDQARDGIRRGAKNGELSKRETKSLRRSADRIDTLSERYARDGLTDSEQRDLGMMARATQSIVNAQRAQGASRRIK